MDSPLFLPPVLQSHVGTHVVTRRHTRSHTLAHMWSHVGTHVVTRRQGSDSCSALTPDGSWCETHPCSPSGKEMTSVVGGWLDDDAAEMAENATNWAFAGLAKPDGTATVLREWLNVLRINHLNHQSPQVHPNHTFHPKISEACPARHMARGPVRTRHRECTQ